MKARIRKAIQSFIFHHDLWKRGEKIIIAVSGGSDSVFLACFLAHLGKKYQLQLHLAHVNYGLRGKASDKDEQLVERLAKKLCIPFSVYRVTESNQKNDSEMALRNIRYQFFDKLRKKIDFDLVAIGRTMDDQAETLLLRLIRGTGLAGLSSMRPKRGIFVRPLLSTRKKEILAYLSAEGIQYRTDQSNKDVRYLRNAVRRKLIPLLENRFNPNIVELLAKTAELAADDYDFIARQAKIYDRFMKTNEKGEHSFSCNKFMTLPVAIQRQLLRKIFATKTKAKYEIGFSQIEELLKALKSTKSKPQMVEFGGLKMARKGDRVLLLSK